MIWTRLAAAVLFVTFASSLPLVAGSYYPARLDDAKALYLTPDDFAVKGDGVADDSAGVQQAIDAVHEKTNQGILFVPSGTYRLTKTIYIWPGIRLIGFGATRSEIYAWGEHSRLPAGADIHVLLCRRASRTETRRRRMRHRARFILR